MAIFGFHVTAANDFVFGIPIVEAFFPHVGLPNLAANAVVQNILFQGCSLVILGIGAEEAATGATRASVLQHTWRQLVQDPLLCAIVLAAACLNFMQICTPPVPHISLCMEDMMFCRYCTMAYLCC